MVTLSSLKNRWTGFVWAAEVKRAIENEVRERLRRQKLNPKDILVIAHICDLEYALYRTSNNSGQNKRDQAYRFNEAYSDDPELSKRQLDNIPFIASVYEPSWNRQKLKENAYERISNFSLLFSWLSDLIPKTFSKDV